MLSCLIGTSVHKALARKANADVAVEFPESTKECPVLNACEVLVTFLRCLVYMLECMLKHNNNETLLHKV